jgi:hypothetical protein
MYYSFDERFHRIVAFVPLRISISSVGSQYLDTRERRVVTKPAIDSIPRRKRFFETFVLPRHLEPAMSCLPP